MMQTKYVEKRLASLLDNHVKFTIVNHTVKPVSMKFIMITCVVYASFKSHKHSS